MSDCCKTLGKSKRQGDRFLCSHCGREGQPVDRTTIDALLKPESLSQVNGSQYAFCETPSCPVVYYAADGTEFEKNQVLVRVGLKETEDPVPVCYCFGVTERMIHEEIQRTGRSSASARIRTEVKEGNCRCEVENPSGRCCLGEVRQAEKRAAAESKGSVKPSHVPEERRSSMRLPIESLDHSGATVPLATETATRLLSMTESMLGWRLHRAGLNPREEAVRQYILTQYPRLGRAPGCQEIATALGLNKLGDVRAILERLHELDLLYLDSDSREIRLAYPFSTIPTTHHVQFRDWPAAKPVYAPCAVDALGIPFMMDRDVSIESRCAYCEMPVAIKVRDRSIESCIPAETVVWVGTAYRGHAATSICPTLDFFCSPTDVAAWREARPQEEGYVLSLGEALYLGKGIFEDLLRPQSGAVSSSGITAPLPETKKAAMMASTAGGLLAAFLASICCIGPVVFAALGVGVGATGFLAGTAGFLKALLPYRPLFIGLTTVFLGVGFYVAYRRPMVGGASCQACVSTSGFRPNRWLLWIIAGLAVALVLAPYWLELATGS